MKAGLALLVVGAVVLGCGGGSRFAGPPPKPQQEPKKPALGAQLAPGQAAPGPKVNPSALLLRPYFLQWLKRPPEAKTDPFVPKLAEFAPFVEIKEEEVATQEEPKTPLEFYDVDAYRLVLIMSGTATPKAMVVDPKGRAYVIQEGTKIGNKGGKVVSITATEVRIDEPGRPPRVKVLLPPSKEMVEELQAVQEF